MSYSHFYANQTKVIKIYSWLAYDVFLAGLLTYNWFVLQVTAFATALDAAEKFILFMCTTIFAGYRIYSLHLETERKRFENRELKEKLSKKKTA